MDKKEECTIKDLCKMYNVTSMTIERWRKKKNMPYYKRGRNIFFKLTEIEEWMKEQNKVRKYN